MSLAIEEVKAVPPLLFDLSDIDLDAVAVDLEGMQKYLKQRGAAQQIDHIIWCTDDYTKAVAQRRIRDDEWWVEGHIPGNPIFPAVMMVEAAAQLASFMYLVREVSDYEFVGFTRIDNTKFRNKLVPGDMLYLLGQELKFQRRRLVCDVQGVSEGRLIFETRISGMPIIK